MYSSILLSVPPTKTIIWAWAFCISASPPTVWNILPSAVREASRNLNFCTDRRDIFFNAFLVDYGCPSPLYYRRNWLWINGATYKSSDWLIDWLTALEVWGSTPGMDMVEQTVNQFWVGNICYQPQPMYCHGLANFKWGRRILSYCLCYVDVLYILFWK